MASRTPGGAWRIPRLRNGFPSLLARRGALLNIPGNGVRLLRIDHGGDRIVGHGKMRDFTPKRLANVVAAWESDFPSAAGRPVDVGGQVAVA